MDGWVYCLEYGCKRSLRSTISFQVCNIGACTHPCTQSVYTSCTMLFTICVLFFYNIRVLAHNCVHTVCTCLSLVLVHIGGCTHCVFISFRTSLYTIVYTLCVHLFTHILVHNLFTHPAQLCLQFVYNFHHPSPCTQFCTLCLLSTHS